MLQWLQNNWANLLVGSAVLVAVSLSIVRLRAQKKSSPHGCSSCGGGCSGCAHRGEHCQPEPSARR